MGSAKDEVKEKNGSSSLERCCEPFLRIASAQPDHQGSCNVLLSV
jgi:hypothetical protein